MTQMARRRSLLVVLLAAVALLVSGCMKIDMDLTLNADDSVDGSIIMAFSDEVAEMLGTDPESLWADAGSDFESDFPEGADQEPYAQDGYTGTKVTFVDIPIEEMSGTGDVDSLSITREGDEFVVSGAMDLSDTGDMAGAEALMSGFDVRIAVTFPGSVTEHNGTLDGRTVTWEPQVGERTEIMARGSATGGGLAGGLTGGGSSWLPIVLGVLALAVVGAVVAIVVMSRRKRPEAAASGAGVEAYPSTYPAAPYPQAGYPQPPVQPYPQPPVQPYPQPPVQPYPQPPAAQPPQRPPAPQDGPPNPTA